MGEGGGKPVIGREFGYANTINSNSPAVRAPGQFMLVGANKILNEGTDNLTGCLTDYRMRR
jgi:hypothetical protein